MWALSSFLIFFEMSKIAGVKETRCSRCNAAMSNLSFLRYAASAGPAISKTAFLCFIRERARIAVSRFFTGEMRPKKRILCGDSFRGFCVKNCSGMPLGI